MSKFKIYLYRTSSGKEVILDFIRTFLENERTKIHNDLDQLKQYGLQLLQTPLVKKIYQNPPLYELRIKTIHEIRLLFYFYKQNTFIILHGFKKKSNKLPRKEIKIILNRVKQFT